MGALTLKNFPFELRRWDIEKFDSIDFTDSFGLNTKIYTNKNKIIQIEPNCNNFNNWLSDKGRQFFDSIFKLNYRIKTKTLIYLIQKIIKKIYIFDHCNKHNKQIKFITFIFDNISIEVFNSLFLIFHNYSFVKLWKTDHSKINTNLENNFQLNNSLNSKKLSLSTLALIVSTNPRYEGYHLNLLLWQRTLKGNFKCLIIGSLINLTFPILTLGSNLSIIKTIFAGTNLICQNLKLSKNPVIVYNYELLKWNDSTNKIFKILNLLPLFNKTWNGLNFLDFSLFNNSVFVSYKIFKLNFSDLNNFSMLYFINTTANTVFNLKKLTELKLLKLISTKIVFKKKLIIDQNYKANQNYVVLNKMLNDYLYLPNTTFYENSETFINNFGFIKWTVKMISAAETKNVLQILKKILRHLVNRMHFLTKKNFTLFDFNKLFNFKNFINFYFYATVSLTNLNFYTNIKNKPIKLKKHRFKLKKDKIIASKLKYWLDDFFNGSRDEYSWNSIVLNKCSKLLKKNCTNFF